MIKTDPVTLEVVHSALFTVAEEMSTGLQRSAYSSNIKTRLDYACAIFDSRLRNIVQDLKIPSMLGGLVNIVPSAVREYGKDRLEVGDGVLTNDPYRGGTHLPDVTLINPVFYGGEIFCYVANVAHHQDMGGRAPGSVPGDTTEIYQEGFIIPPIKLLEKGEVREDLLKIVLANVRASWERAGDYRAQIAANKLGVKLIHSLIEKYGAETLRAYMEAILDYTERRMRREIQRIPEGTYTAEDYLDNQGVTQDPVRIAVDVTVEDGDVVIDLSRSDEQGPGPMNAALSPTCSAVFYVFKCVTDPDMPPNHGMYRPLHIVAPEGLVVHAVHPAATAGCWEVAQRVVDTILKALAEPLRDRICAAGKGIICNISFGGIDPRSGRVYAFYETVGGGYGGRPTIDGMDGVQSTLTNTQNAPLEELELCYPVMMERYGLIPDSEGPGEYRGGLGIRRDYRFHGHEATFSVLSDRGRYPPWGLFGGLSARTSRYIINPESENPVILNSKDTVTLKPGDLVRVETPGGGGYGDPIERRLEAILEDVRNGKVSVERARTFYGVIIDPENGRIDTEATERFRSSRKKSL